MKKTLFTAIVIASLTACQSDEQVFDASGIFEADEVIVAAEVTGKIKSLSIKEGDQLAKGATVGSIDADNLGLQKAQVLASIDALSDRQNVASPQIDILNEQINNQQQNILTLREQLKIAKVEQKRMANLVQSEAVPTKQLDDVNGQVAVLSQQINAAESQVKTLGQQIKSQRQIVDIQNRGVLSEGKPLKQRVAQIDDQIKRSTISNPIDGTVLTKYLTENEIATVGKPIYKIAQTQTLILRAYITGNQLNQVKVGQQVSISTGAEKTQKTSKGNITWISSKAEFTPKTIQTADERSNLVYAIKIAVPNDGFLKIGMYGDVTF
jgi:HlyD family secretion protein